MTIVFFARLFYPHIGGVEKHVLEISKLLIKKGHKVIVITEDLSTKDIPVYLQSRNDDSIKIHRISVGKNNWFKKFRIWIWLWENRKIIKNANIVHAHDVFFWYLPFRFLYFRKPIFTTFHGYESYPISRKAILQRKIAEKLSMGNICIGDFIKKWYGTKPDFVSYGGVDIVHSSRRKGQSRNSAVFVGRLDEQTGILTYVNAVKLIRKKIPDFKFEIIGDGKYRREIEKDFKVLGFQENPEKYFAKYNFAFVSRYLSILEAMAAKRLVFAVYDNPLKEDYLKTTPFAKHIVIVGSEEELAEKIIYFLKNEKEKQKKIEGAFTWVRNQSWENVSNLYLNLW